MPLAEPRSPVRKGGVVHFYRSFKMSLNIDAFPYSLSVSLYGICCQICSEDEKSIEAIKSFLRYFPETPQPANLRFFIFLRDLDEFPVSLFLKSPIYSDETLGVDYLRLTDNQPFPDSSLAIRVRRNAITFCDLERRVAVGYLGSHRNWMSWEISHLFFYPALAEMLKTLDMFFVHAAAVAKAGKGLLFPAKTQSGKTTLSLALIEKNFKILSDDLVILKRSSTAIKALGFLEEVNVRPDTVKLLGQLSKRLSESINIQEDNKNKWAIDINKVYPDSVLRSADLSLMIFPEVSPDGKTRLDRISSAEAIKGLLPNTFVIIDKKLAQKHFELLCDLADKVPAYRLQAGRNLQQATEEIEKIIP